MIEFLVVYLCIGLLGLIGSVTVFHFERKR